MSIKRKPSVLGQFWNFCVALTFFASQAFVIWRVVQSGNAGLLVSPSLALGLIFGIILLWVDVTLLCSPISAGKRRRALQGARAGDDALAPPWRYPLDPALALPVGKTLTVALPATKTGAGSVIIVGIIVLLLLAVFLAACGEALIVPAFPTVGAWLTLSATDVSSVATPPVLDPLDWAALALPVVPILLFGVMALIAAWRNGNSRIIADDAGITLRARARSEFIPWHDIVVGLKSELRNDRGISGEYQLRGRTHALNFILRTPLAMALAIKTAPKGMDAFLAKYQPYTDDAKILIATMIARSGVTIRTFSPDKTSNWMTGNAHFKYLSAEDINQFPLAITMPVADTPDSRVPLPDSASLILKRLTPFWRLLQGMLLFAVLFTAFLYGMSVRMAPDFNMTPGDFVAPAMLATFSCIFIFACLYHYLLLWTQWQTKEPTVIATKFDITTKTQESKSASTVRWEDVRAWAVQLPRDPATMPTRYIIATEVRTLTWIEQPHGHLSGRMVRGDRRVAYRTLAAQLHALIAARTNLPLHEVSAPPTA